MSSKRKVTNYLNSKAESEYTKLDIILKQYVDGELEAILTKRLFSDIDILPIISKNDKGLEITLNYFNLGATLVFKESYYEYAVYSPCEILEEESIVEIQYDKEFNVESAIDEIVENIKADKKLNTTNEKTEERLKHEKKKKVYKILARICFIFPFVVIGIITLCVTLSGTELSLGPWFGVAYILILLLSIFLNYKSHR